MDYLIIITGLTSHFYSITHN